MPRPRAIPDTLLELLIESSRPIYAIDERRQIIFCNPALATWLQLEFVRGRQPFPRLERWQTAYLPVYVGWAAVVVVVFPPVFGFA